MQLSDVLLGIALHHLAVVELQLLHKGEAGLLGGLHPGQDGENPNDHRYMQGDVFLERWVAEELFIGSDLIRHPQVIGDFDQDHAALHRFILFVVSE